MPNELTNWLSRKLLSKRINDINLPPSGPIDPRLNREMAPIEKMKMGWSKLNELGKPKPKR